MLKEEVLELIKNIKPINNLYAENAEKSLDEKMKPYKSLGIIEDIVIKLAGIYGYPLRQLSKKCHIVVSADNGIIEEGVSSCPVEYTSLVSEAMLNNIAAIGIFCKELNINLDVINVGMISDIKRQYPNYYNFNIRKGTDNFYKKRAMSLEEVFKSIKLGIDIINDRKHFDIFSNGEMGIGNTTTSSAVLYSITKENIENIVGRGGGLSDISLINKKRIIKESCEKYNTFDMGIFEILSHVGGIDLCVMVGMYIGCALNKKLMLVDGFISGVAALAAVKLNPNIKNYILFTHKSEEPGMKTILKELKTTTFLNMNMRLGEGTGAVLAYPIIDCAIGVSNNMKTPDEVYKMFTEV